MSVPRLLKNPLSWVVAANVGLFAALTGGRIVWPGHTSWLMWGDSAQHYLGWEFFRRGPLTVWPPGASPLFGVGYSSSVVYADAIPLLALPMKFLLAFTDARFQYLGIWLLACFVLQGVFAVKLLQRFSMSGPVLVPGALLFSIAPVFIYRMVIGGYGHMALAGHFVVLWAMYLVLDAHLSHRRWRIILLVSLLVQFYLFVIVGYLYLVTVILCYRRERIRTRWREHLSGGLSNVILVLIIGYIAGYFTNGAVSADGFGVFRSDLLGFIDPDPNDFPGWSLISPGIYNIDGTQEGYSYLGIGVVLALLISLLVPAWRRGLQLHPGCRALVVAAAPPFLLAITNDLELAGRELISLPVPLVFEEMFNVVRASGRFSWLIVYALTAASLLALCRPRSRRSVVIATVTALVVLQVSDMMKALTEVRERFVNDAAASPRLLDPRWDIAASGMTCLRVSPLEVRSAQWIPLADLALDKSLSINLSHLSRWDSGRVFQLGAVLENDVDELNLVPECLYVLVRNPLLRRNAEIDYLKIRRGELGLTSNVLIEEIDGFIVVRRSVPTTSG